MKATRKTHAVPQVSAYALFAASAGQQIFTFRRNKSSPGQLALGNAALSAGNYAFKIETPPSPENDFKTEVQYFTARVSGLAKQTDAEDAPLVATLSITSNIVSDISVEGNGDA